MSDHLIFFSSTLVSSPSFLCSWFFSPLPHYSLVSFHVGALEKYDVSFIKICLELPSSEVVEVDNVQTQDEVLDIIRMKADIEGNRSMQCLGNEGFNQTTEECGGTK